MKVERVQKLLPILLSAFLVVVAFLPATSALAIVGGKLTGPENRIASHTVLLETFFEGYFLGRCSGTLIAPHAILTAAHCVSREPDQILIRFNDGTLLTSNHYEIHPEYDSRVVHADLAVIFFKGAVPRSFRPATLVNSAMKFSETWMMGLDVQIAGYGLSDNLLEHTPQLRIAELRVMDHFHDTIQLESDYGFAAPGDSGGPAFLLSARELLQWGVASFVDSESGRRSYYTFIGPYLPWIKSQCL